MALINMDDNYVHVNRTLCNMVGYSETEILSKQHHLVHPDDWAATKRSLHALLADELHNSFMEKRLVAKDGSVVWVSQNTTVIRMPDGTPWLFLLQMQDITQSTINQEALREANLRAESNDRLKTALL